MCTHTWLFSTEIVGVYSHMALIFMSPLGRDHTNLCIPIFGYMLLIDVNTSAWLYKCGPGWPPSHEPTASSSSGRLTSSILHFVSLSAYDASLCTCVCVCRHVCSTPCMWRSEDSLGRWSCLVGGSLPWLLHKPEQLASFASF